MRHPKRGPTKWDCKETKETAANKGHTATGSEDSHTTQARAMTCDKWTRKGLALHMMAEGGAGTETNVTLWVGRNCFTNLVKSVNRRQKRKTRARALGFVHRDRHEGYWLELQLVVNNCNSIWIPPLLSLQLDSASECKCTHAFRRRWLADTDGQDTGEEEHKLPVL